MFLLHWPKRNCLSGRGCYETFLFSALCRAVRARQSAAAGRIPAGQNRAGAFGTGVVRRGPGTGNARCRLSAALRPGQRDLPHCRPERWRGRVGAPPGLPHRGRGGGNAHHLAGRGAESPGHRGPQLRLYCRDHAQDPTAGWLTADPARRQGYLTDAVLRSYWGTAYEANYARLSALVDSVLTQVLYYEDAPAGTSYFAISNGQTEASENVWGTAVPYLIPVDSSTDQNADNYIYTVSFSAAQLQQLLTGLGLTPDLSAPEAGSGMPPSLPPVRGLPARLRPDRDRPGTAEGAGPAERLLHGAVSERQLFLHHQRLRPRGRNEPVGSQSAGRAGADGFADPRPLLPRHPAAAVAARCRQKTAVCICPAPGGFSVSFTGTDCPASSTRCSGSSSPSWGSVPPRWSRWPSLQPSLQPSPRPQLRPPALPDRRRRRWRRK